MSVVKTDERMSDWRSSYMRQDKPQKIVKIKRNLDHVTELLSPQDSLLDVGCGRGFIYRYLNHQNYLGIDLDEGEVLEARLGFPDGRFEVGDLFSLDGQWDVVLCSRVLLHVAPLGEAMKSLLKAARKYLVLIVHIWTDDKVDEVSGENGKIYFRSISETTLKSFGPCKIIPGAKQYSTVIYDRVSLG